MVGVPDDARGHLVKAFVVAADGEPGDVTATELQDFVKQQIAPYKYPRAIEFVTELPKTATGKLQRFRLRTPASPSLGRSSLGRSSRGPVETTASDS